MLVLPEKVHTVAASVHPAYAMRGLPQMFPGIYHAVARAKRWAWKDEGPERNFTFSLSPSPAALAQLLEAVPAGTTVAVDVETPDDQPHKVELCGVATGPSTALCFPWTGDYIQVARDFLSRKDIIKVGHNFAFDQRAIRASGADVAFPMVDTIQAGALLWPPYKEVKKRRWLALATCVTRVIDGVAYWKDADNPRTRAVFKVAYPRIPDFLHPRLYCALDCIYTLQLWHIERRLLDDEGMLKLYTDAIAPAAPVLVHMEETGMPIDEVLRGKLKLETEKAIYHLKISIHNFVREFHEKRMQLIKEAIRRLEKRRTMLTPVMPVGPDVALCPKHPDYWGKTRRKKCEDCARVYVEAEPLRGAINEIDGRIRKGKNRLETVGEKFSFTDDAWRWLFFDKNGLDLRPISFTEKKRIPQVSDEIVERLFVRHPEHKVLRERVELQHGLHRIRNTLNVPVDENGRVHFAYSAHRTVHGRLASGLDDDEDDKRRESEGGNAQNIPDRDRQIYTCSSEKTRLVGVDWSQIEARVMAHLAEEEAMVKAFRAGVDVHSLNAAAIFNIDPGDASTHMVRFEGSMVSARHAAKRATHGWDYGMGDSKTAAMYGLDFEEARRCRLAYFEAWPGLVRYHEKLIALVNRLGYLRNPFGRKLRFWNFDRNDIGERMIRDREEVLAYVPASTVGDMCKAVLPAIEEATIEHGGELLTTTHDSFLSDVPVENVDSYQEAARKILEQPWVNLGEFLGESFTCPAKFSVGKNWADFHPTRNPEGLRE